MTALGFALVSVALLLAVLWFGQRRLIYFPDRSPPPLAARIAANGIDVRFTTEDGLELSGWYLAPADGQPPSARRTVLVFNGNAGNRAYRLPLAAALLRRGAAVLLFDYRGYGGNPGAPSEQGLIRDARAAHDWLTAREDVDPAGLVYFGESLGAAVAVALAAERPPSALVLRSPFRSLVDVGRAHYPWLPVGLILRDRYPSIERIRLVESPLLVIAGQDDSIVPHSQSRELFDASPAERKRFVSLPGADHNDPRLGAGAEMIDDVTEFLGEIR